VKQKSLLSSSFVFVASRGIAGSGLSATKKKIARCHISHAQSGGFVGETKMSVL
jgi:hypothetical protein